MIIYNDKEMESEYCLSDDALIIINSSLSLSEIFDRLSSGKEISTDEANIKCYLNKEGKTVFEDNDKDVNSYTGRYLYDDEITDYEEQMVMSEGYGKRAKMFQAYEAFGYGNTYEDYSFKKKELDTDNEEDREFIRTHIAISSGVMPTLLNEKKSLKELTALSSLGNDLYRNFGKGSVNKYNTLPTIEEIEYYADFTEYEKQLVRKGNIPPKNFLHVKKELEKSVCKGYIITNDRKIPAFIKTDNAEEYIENRLENKDKIDSLIPLFKAEFKKQYGFDKSPIIPEFIYGLAKVKGNFEFTPEEIEEAVKSFNRNSMQAVVHTIHDKEKNKDVNITVAQTRNPALIYLATKMPMQDMPKQLIRALATYVTVDNIKALNDKGFDKWIKEHKNESIADLVKLFTVIHKINNSLDMDRNAFELYQTAVNINADMDRIKYEEKYNYKFSDNETAIRGRNIVVEQGPYKIYMLKPDDLRNFSVAYTENTHCCQHFGNAGESCVWKYTTDPFAACVIVEDKTGQIQAQGFVWTDEEKDLFVFDNIEYHHDPSAYKLTNIIEAYIEALPYKNVQIGMGYVEAKDQAWNGIGSPISTKDVYGKIPTTLKDRHVYSDYHTDGGSRARVMKKVDGRNGEAHLVKYNVRREGLTITNPGDEPTKWDKLASKEFVFMLNDYTKSIDERIAVAESFNNNPSREVIDRVYSSAPRALLMLDNIPEDIQIDMFNKHKDIAMEIKNPCIELQARLAVDNPSYLKTIENPDPSVIRSVLEKNGLLINIVANPTIEDALIAVKQNGYAYRFIPENLLTEEVKMEAVKQSPKVVSLLKNPSIDLQITAVRKDPNVALLLNDPDVRVIATAVSIKPDIIFSLKNIEAPVARAAINKNPNMIKKLQFQYPELRMEAIRKNGFVIKDLKDPTAEEIDAAIRQNPNVERFVSRAVDTHIDIYENDGEDGIDL